MDSQNTSNQTHVNQPSGSQGHHSQPPGSRATVSHGTSGQAPARRHGSSPDTASRRHPASQGQRPVAPAQPKAQRPTSTSHGQPQTRPCSTPHTPHTRSGRGDSASNRPRLSFPAAFLETLRERARITDLFPPAALKRQGAEFLTLCPWHADTNASLTISPRTNRVHCFVCNKGADAIGWLQDNQGLTFSEAVQELARRYNLPLPEQDPQAAAEAEAHRQECLRLLAWRERQQQQFHQALLADLNQMGPAAIALRQRGLTEDTANAWGLGVNGSRLMLPLRDAQGRTRAFSGRSLTGEEPKYLNSANDALFRKQDLLFGLDRAGPAIRRSGEALLVEGPLDVIQLHQADLDHTVASLGTAFSLEQAQRLIRCGAKRLWIALDGDKAGQAATTRVIEALRPLAIAGQLDVLVVSLPPGEDPDSLVHRHGAEALRRCLSRARHWLLWQLDQLLGELNGDPDDFSALQRCERQGAELLALLPAGALRKKAEQRLREGLGVVPEGVVLKSSVHQGVAHRAGKGPVSGGQTGGCNPDGEANPEPAGAPSVQDAVAHAERRALRLFLCCPTLREVLSVLVLTDPLHREAMGWLWCLTQRLGGVVRPPDQGPFGAPKAPVPEDGLREAALAALPHLDPPLASVLSPLLHCGETVRAKLAAHPEGELMCILDVLEPVE